jgi:signal transduction histidine kinase
MAIAERLGRRLGRTIATQVVAIGLVSVVGVWAAAFTIEHVLIEEALRDEASHYWNLLSADPSTPPPNTQNLTGFLSSDTADLGLPRDFRALSPGYHSLPSLDDLSVAYVSERDGKTLVLVFEGAQVRELSVYFGLAPLGLLLTVVYAGVWWSYRMTRRAVSPVEWLAKQVNRIDPKRPDPSAFSLSRLTVPADSEVIDLANALAQLTARVNEFVDRERNFTRDASHELRSPLTVVRMSADMLLDEHDLDDETRVAVKRIKRASTDMVELVEAFLLLAREAELGTDFEPVCVNDVVADEIERISMIAGSREVKIRTVESERVMVSTSGRVLSSLLGNLIRNAVAYTERGEVVAEIQPTRVVVRDTGPGMSGAEVAQAFQPFVRGSSRPPGSSHGHGVGLTIVKRLSDRFDWPVTIDSKPGAGTRVTVDFSSTL